MNSKILVFNTSLFSSLLSLILHCSPALACAPGISKELNFIIPVRNGYGYQTQSVDNPFGNVGIPGSGRIVGYTGSPVTDRWNITAYVNGEKVFVRNNASVGSRGDFEICGRNGRNTITLEVRTDDDTNSDLNVVLNGKLCVIVIDHNGTCS